HLHLAYPRHASLIELIKGNREVDVEAALPGETVDVDDMDQFGSTPLILAAQRDWAFVVGELLRRPGVDPNHQNLFGSTALICAAANGYISTLEELLGDQRVDLEVSTRLGQTALFKAVLFGHMNTTERLLQAGAQAKITNKMGQTLLDVVREHQHSTVKELLARFGQEPADGPGGFKEMRVHLGSACIVRGNFTANGQNHGKPTYKKEDLEFGDHQVNGLDVMLYYWDERDGPNFCGWWFGPKVGGDQVWAYHPSRQSLTPPTKGWKVPYDGPVDDSFSICPTSLANANAAQQNYPQGFQQAPGKGGGYQAPGAYAGQQPGPGAGGKGSYGNMPQNDQQRHELQAQNRRQHEQRRLCGLVVQE
ncbi:unnamed protein product, partial [Symbiodinium necroappetens]